MKPETLKTNVLIIGKGVSGLLLSILLERNGISSIILNRETKKKPLILAETLPPSTLKLLEELDVLHYFEANSTKTYGYQSIWNTKEIIEENFFTMNPYKYGLKLNKQQLINCLEKLSPKIIQQKNNANIKLGTTKVLTNFKEKDLSENYIESDFIIDATGRNRAVISSLGIPSTTHDDTLAFICYLPKNGPHLKYGFLTESFYDGWGTISNLNETTQILTLYTSKNSKLKRILNCFSNWKNILSETIMLRHYLPENGVFKVIGKQANSSIVSKTSGKNWIAIGDAAISFDPIASHGISNAVYTANEASKTIIKYYEKSKQNSLVSYNENLHLIFNEYLKLKENLYATQKVAKIS